jgi:hypothetical protein
MLEGLAVGSSRSVLLRVAVQSVQQHDCTVMCCNVAPPAGGSVRSLHCRQHGSSLAAHAGGAQERTRAHWPMACGDGRCRPRMPSLHHAPGHMLGEALCCACCCYCPCCCCCCCCCCRCCRCCRCHCPAAAAAAATALLLLLLLLLLPLPLPLPLPCCCRRLPLPCSCCPCCCQAERI